MKFSLTWSRSTKSCLRIVWMVLYYCISYLAGLRIWIPKTEKSAVSVRSSKGFKMVTRQSIKNEPQRLLKTKKIIFSVYLLLYFLPHSSPRRLAGEKKSTSYNHKTTIWVSHEYYLNPEFHKILSRAFWVIAILRFFPYVARVDFKGLISK